MKASIALAKELFSEGTSPSYLLLLYRLSQGALEHFLVICAPVVTGVSTQRHCISYTVIELWSATASSCMGCGKWVHDFQVGAVSSKRNQRTHAVIFSPLWFGGNAALISIHIEQWFVNWVAREVHKGSAKNVKFSMSYDWAYRPKQAFTTAKDDFETIDTNRFLGEICADI